ncbi:hypothetical protein BST21_02300 [Mycolicibacterium celeriflavum]|nr:hypothetical protein BST21_02300 [Mycolicibacterium celeriflavum]
MDVNDIWDYTRERWSDDQAERYLREIQRAIERIVDNPLIGRRPMRYARATAGMRSVRRRCTTELPAMISLMWCACSTSGWSPPKKAGGSLASMRRIMGILLSWAPELLGPNVCVHRVE